MTGTDIPAPRRAGPRTDDFVSSRQSPFLRGPEEVSTIYRVTTAAALLPVLGGVVLFGWRAAVVTAIAVASCAGMEWLYYRVSRAPALLGRSHAYLTGVLLAMTLPAGVPWYIPAVAGAFAILVGKAIFGGVGHFLWQPALVGRLAVGVLFASAMNPTLWPLLGQDKLFWGDLREAKEVQGAPAGDSWLGRPAPEGADAVLLPPPAAVLAGLSHGEDPQYSAIAYWPDFSSVPKPRPTLLSHLPSIPEMLLGARGGGIGETSIALIVLGGFYLMYRGWVKWQLPVAMLAAAGLVAAAAPIRLAGAGDPPVTIQVWWPALAGDSDVGMLYVCYQLFGGGLVLSAFFLATEMTTRPVTTGGQVVFGAGCGALAMALQLYADTSIPAYLAVLALNTLTPLIESVCRPRVLGTSRLPWRR